MRRLIVNTFVSLDGVMQAPGGPDEDPVGGFEHGGWAVNYWDDEMMGRMAAPERPYELLLGRGTYEIFAAHWPYAEGPIADLLNGMRKHVASTTLDRLDWDNSTLIPGDVPEYVGALKREDGPEIQVHGSPGLIQTLLRHDLIDELRVWTFPLLLGTGKRLFGDGTVPAALRLLDHEATATGVTISTYERAGEIDSGSFEFDEPTDAEIERRRKLAGR
jgi:dihydrofolate reductase